MNDFLLEMRGIHKCFGAVQALADVDLRVRRGSVHALIGENGAGKSTLMKILSGSLQPDRGSMLLDGRSYRVHSPGDARSSGVSMIYQELTLTPHQTVEENITLGAEKSRFGLLQSQSGDVHGALDQLGYGTLKTDAKVQNLSVGVQQIVEIARSLFLQARLLIMDEPTSSLSAEDTRSLFDVIRRLREKGVTVIYISHFLEEVQEIADAYTVLRDGRSVAAGSMSGTALSKLVTAMVGRPLEEMFPRTQHRMGPLAFEVEHLSGPPRVQDVSFSVHAGEILGIAGLIGSGRTEMLRCLYGVSPAESGSVKVRGRDLNLHGHSAGSAIRLSMGLVSEDRKNEGLAVGLPIRDNMSLSSLGRYVRRRGAGWIDGKREIRDVRGRSKDLSIKYRSIMDTCVSLSGGNQQKVVLGRILMEGGDILFLDEPTRGIDVKSKVEIYSLIGRLAAEGKAVVMVSSYLPELFGICDTLAVMHRGRLSPLRPVREWTEERVMAWATTGKMKASGTRKRGRKR
ncbi:sugar ABC transporter ATP-binding protein [bacterium]|nr:sugar ABC transporter ATP-binding protein [bacterium]